MLMYTSTTVTLASLLNSLTIVARQKGLNDTAWAAASGFSKETHSRLRRRSSCDLSTLLALAETAGARLSVSVVAQPTTTSDGHFPSEVSRDYEQQLLTLCASRTLDPTAWAGAGPAFFMAGLAVMLASNPDADRRGLLELAETLHPGATELPVFATWLRRSPVRPSRFLPMLTMESKHAA
jgi:DNA-binding phage protein